MRRRSSAERGGMVEGRQPFGIRGAGMKGFAHELVDNGQPQRARGRRWRRRVLLEPSPSYHPRPLHIGTCGQANWHVRAAADSLGLTAAENGGDEAARALQEHQRPQRALEPLRRILRTALPLAGTSFSR